MRVNKQIAALALSAVMGASSFCAVPVMAAGTVQSTETAPAQKGNKERKGPEDVISGLVENGTISKETGEKINNYIKENMPEQNFNRENMPEQNFNKENRPEKKTDADSSASKKRPDKNNGNNANGGKKEKKEKKNNANGEKKEKKEKKNNGNNADTNARNWEGNRGNVPGHGMFSQEFLDKLLADKVITQEEYDALKKALPERPERPADGENRQKEKSRKRISLQARPDIYELRPLFLRTEVTFFV